MRVLRPLFVLLLLSAFSFSAAEEDMEEMAGEEMLVTQPTLRGEGEGPEEPEPIVKSWKAEAGRHSRDSDSSNEDDDHEFVEAFWHSTAMIIATEIGDKTFFLAALMAMRFSRTAVFAGAFGALALMTVLSALIGFALPNLIPRLYTHYAAAVLFAFFGIRMLKEAREMKAGECGELEEAEEELKERGRANSDAEEWDVEKGQDKKKKIAAKKKSSALFWKVVIESFTVNVLAEWGDRSQIATIALAAARDPFGVTLGGVFGHFFSTGLAVLGGKMLSSKISDKTLAICGGVLFVLFAVHSLWVGPIDT